jgi:FkbM family methyltransferase
MTAEISKVLRRSIDRFRPLRAVVKSRAGQYLIQTARGAGVVREPVRFAALQTGPPRVAGYHLGDSGAKVFLRHRSRDVNILNEIFGGTGGRRSYEPPAPVARLLDSVPSPAIFDLGGNIGLFGLYALSRWPGSTVRSFEPDPANLSVLARTVDANGFRERWSVSECAVANTVAEMDFVAGLSADSYLSSAARGSGEQKSDGASGQSIVVRTVDFFAGDPCGDLLKMDIEGGEWTILGDRRFASLKIDALVLEWHARGCPYPDPREATLRLLRTAGYDRLEEVSGGSESGLLWAWREHGRRAGSVDRR